MHKSLGVQGCKVLSAEEGIVEAFVSGIGNKDSVGDIILPGAFEKFLRTRKPKGVWSHDWEKPISKTLDIYEVPSGDSRLPLKMQLAGIGGLYVKTQFNLNTQLGKDAYETVKFFGDEAEWSIGYQVHDQEYDKKTKAMLLKEIELFEYSPVLFGANELTSTVSIKAHRGEDGELEIEVDGLEDIESKAVKAALDVILKEKSVTVKGIENTEIKFWHVEERNGEYCVINHELDTVEGCFNSENEAYAKMSELYNSMEATEEVLPAIGTSVSGEKSAVRSHSTGTSEGSWDGPANEARARSGESLDYYRNIYAWQDSEGDPTTKAAWRFIHHEVNGSGDPGDANIQACRTGIGVLNGGRGGTTIPEADRQGVYNHLARHIRDAGLEPPTLKSLDELIEEKAAVEDVKRGVLVRWGSSGGTAYGQVVAVVTNGTAQAEPEGPSMEGTPENPAIRVRVWEFNVGEWSATDTITVHRAGSLTIIDQLPAAKSFSVGEEKAISDVDLTPTDSMIASAERGLKWRDEFNRGGTAIGVARARDISNGRSLSPETVRRMKSYFARHAVDKQAQGFDSGEDGFPSAGRIAWELWGGDSGASWSERKVAELEREMEKEISEDLIGNKANHNNEEDAVMADNSIEGKKAYSVYANGDLFMVVDDATGEVEKWFTNRDFADLYAAKENAEEVAEMAEQAYEDAEAAAEMASEGEMETDSMMDTEKSIEAEVSFDEKVAELEAEVKAGRVLADRHVTALRKAADEIMHVLAACGAMVEDEKSESSEEIEVKDAEVVSEEKVSDESEVETKDAEVEDSDVAETDIEEVEVSDGEDTNTEDEEANTEVEDGEKSDDSEVETKDSDVEEEKVAEISTDPEVTDVDFMKNLAEFEEILSDQLD